MTDWMFETLLWTAVLITFVLLVRRPVSRMFGPQMAYALWALPALRLILPPIELPAWMRPIEPDPAVTSETALMFSVSDIPAVQSDGSAGVEAAATEAATPLTPIPSFDIGPVMELALYVWLIGAAIFLYLRFAAYFQLRDELLEGGRELGRSGKVRLVETPGTNAPLAFGVVDKVVALPEGFLAQPDRRSRDLALAHEMAHHRGHDLLANVLVQPLFAIHWWNPLGRYGWLALRRDQEAACDARVMAESPKDEREVYANLIVSFAAGPNIALAAPMACPVLGEKSIIHRLRSLKMDNTTKNRRMAGRLMLGAAVIALPMTASISYAASEAPFVPEAPAAPQVAIAPPAPPAPPVAPEAPSAPEIPDVPEVNLVEDQIIVIDPDAEASADVERSARAFVVRDRDVQVHVSRDADKRVQRRFQRISFSRNHAMTKAEMEEIMEGVRESLEEAHATLDMLPEIIDSAMAAAEESRERVMVVKSCDNDSDDVAHTFERSDGVTVIQLCKSRAFAHALEGLREARDELADNEEIRGETRERVLRQLDSQIERWESKARSPA